MKPKPSATAPNAQPPIPEPSVRMLAARARASQPWFLYLIQCRGGAIYTGIARNVSARYAAHVAGTGARYTRANPPQRLLVQVEFPDQRAASRAESATKRLTAGEKRALIRVLRLKISHPVDSVDASGAMTGQSTGTSRFALARVTCARYSEGVAACVARKRAVR
jgi:putative endonuclease